MPSFTIFIFLQVKDILLHLSLERKVSNKHPQTYSSSYWKGEKKKTKKNPLDFIQLCESYKGKHRKIESRAVEFKFSESKRMKLSKDKKSTRFLLTTYVYFNYSVTVTLPRGCWEWLHPTVKKKKRSLNGLDIYQTKNNSCVFQTNKSYNFYMHTLYLLCIFTITYWVIYKSSYCPISQNHWVTDAYSELTCWLESTRTWIQLNIPTHCGSQVPSCSDSAGREHPTVTTPPDCRDQLLAQIKIRAQQGRTAAENTLGFSKAFFSLLRDWRGRCWAVLFQWANRPWRHW